MLSFAEAEGITFILKYYGKRSHINLKKNLQKLNIDGFSVEEIYSIYNVYKI